MFSHRPSTLFILAFWLGSMSWLTWAHLRPAAMPSHAPQQADILPEEAKQLPPVRWRILLNGQVAGSAEHFVQRHPDGYGSVESRVDLKNISVDQILQQGLGNLVSLMTRGLGGGSEQFGRLTLSIENTARFDQFGQLNTIECRVSEELLGDCIRLHGSAQDGKLRMRAYLLVATGDGSGTHEPVQDISIPLPEKRMLIDSLAPRTRFTNLKLGQRWSFDTYNPLMPTSPLQVVEATVVGRQTITIAGTNFLTYHVKYERASESGLSLSRHMGDVWVNDEGDVIKQSTGLGPMTLVFEREMIQSRETEEQPK